MCFVDNLKKIASVFDHKINTNEATARNFINPFMVEAVYKVASKYPLTRLAVEDDFDGGRSIGRLDYVVYCQYFAVLVTEAKMSDMRKGITQNIAQLQTAAEVLGLTSFICSEPSHLCIATFRNILASASKTNRTAHHFSHYLWYRDMW
jgi:hypothetical protein